MGTIWIRELTGGLDVRRLAETSPGGTLIRGRDGHINRGGEFEQRAVFQKVYTLPTGETKGLAATPAALVVFGHQGSITGLPSGLGYQQLQHPSGLAMAAIQFATLFKAKLQVIATYSDGSRHVFYDGARVTDVNAPPNLAGSGTPNALLTTTQRMLIASGPFVFFSAIGDSTDYTIGGGGAGEAVVDMSTHSEGAGAITSLARYDSYTAVFARNVVQTWFLDPDPTLFRQGQILANTGTMAARSVTQFGDGDVFYLGLTGIRSLRARDSSNSAATTDIGSAIDALVTGAMETLGEAVAERAIGVIEPKDGRFWLSLGDTIYVFSYFTATRVSAWTEYKPGFTVDDMVVWNDRVWLRSGDDIYVYGSQTGPHQYSSAVTPEAWIPYLDGETPAKAKHLRGIDAAVRGTWEVRGAFDPNNQSASDKLAVIDKTTFGLERIPAVGDFNHISLRFRGLAPVSSTEPARFASALIHFDKDDEEDS